MNKNYYGNVILSEKTKNVYQNIYASQAYDTFFGLHGKFEKNADNTLNSLDLVLTNYKGHYNLSIDTAIIDVIELEDEKYLVLTVTINAPLSAKNDFSLKAELTTEAKAINLETVGFFLVDRRLVSLSGHSYEQLRAMDQASHKPYKNGMFDHEFFYRNGKYCELKQIGDFSIDSKDNINEPFGKRDGNPFCKQRLSQFFVL